MRFGVHVGLTAPWHDRKLCAIKPDNVSAEEARRGLTELVDFATRTLHFLIMAEELGLPQNEYSELRMFTRMDVSVCLLAEDNRYEYFVNEVTEGHNTVWFMQFQDHRKGVFHYEFAAAMGTRVVLKRENILRPLEHSREV
jgi:hypothetical protein